MNQRQQSQQGQAAPPQAEYSTQMMTPSGVTGPSVPGGGNQAQPMINQQMAPGNYTTDNRVFNKLMATHKPAPSTLNADYSKAGQTESPIPVKDQVSGYNTAPTTKPSLSMIHAVNLQQIQNTIQSIDGIKQTRFNLAINYIVFCYFIFRSKSL